MKAAAVVEAAAIRARKDIAGPGRRRTIRPVRNNPAVERVVCRVGAGARSTGSVVRAGRRVRARRVQRTQSAVRIGGPRRWECSVVKRGAAAPEPKSRYDDDEERPHNCKWPAAGRSVHRGVMR